MTLDEHIEAARTAARMVRYFEAIGQRKMADKHRRNAKRHGDAIREYGLKK